MKLSKSPLILKEFFILNSQYRFTEAKEEQIDVRELFASYELDFDFIARDQPPGEIMIFVKISINDSAKPLPGYSIYAEGVAVFEMAENHGLSEQSYSNLAYSSGLSIAINSLRNYLSNMTMYFPFGRFLLPAVDLNDVHEAKRAELKKDEALAKKKKKE